MSYQTCIAITRDQLKGIMPNCRHLEYLSHINEAMRDWSINTCARKAAFLAQMAYESNQFFYMESPWSGQEFEGRDNLGNTQMGDGMRFKGRGPLQLIGRAKYKAAGDALRLDLVNNPGQVKDPDVGFQTSAWLWAKQGLNQVADRKSLTDFRRITDAVAARKSATTDRNVREKYWSTAKSVLNCLP